MQDGPEVATPERLRVTGRSVVAAVVALGLTLAALRVLASSTRVIVWVLIASSTATLVAPAVGWLTRRARLPRGLAVAVVMLSLIGTVAGVTYGIVGDIVHQTNKLERAAPRLAAGVEHRPDAIGRAALEADLSARVQQAVTEIPRRLQGGTPAQAIRSATTRGLAFLAISVLTLFFLLHGPRLADAAARQLYDDERQATARRVGAAIYHRAFGYARATMAMAAGAGLFAFVVARASGDVPGPVPLALWVALWDTVPVIGSVVGAVPIVAFAAAADPAKGAVLAALFVAYAVFETLVLQARFERRTIRVGPFLTAAGGFAGLELYGLAGGLLAVLAITVALVVVDELAPA
jgi:predicted PurR-regulated permease PerM